MRFFFLLFLPFFLCFPGGRIRASDGKGAVFALAEDEGRILGAWKDGFIELWDIDAGKMEERFQLSPYSLTGMVKRPGYAQICVSESDGFAVYRIAVWDYRAKTRLFTLSFGDPVSHLNYSSGGNFLVVTRPGRTDLVHPETGEILRSAVLDGTPSFAAAGKSGRSLMIYFPRDPSGPVRAPPGPRTAGFLAYHDLELGTESAGFGTPVFPGSPVLFGNNRFFAGVDREGMAVIDAVTSAVVAREPEVKEGAFLSADPRGLILAALSPGTNGYELFRWRLEALDDPGEWGVILEERRKLLTVNPVPGMNIQSTGNAGPAGQNPASFLVLDSERAVLGTEEGKIIVIHDGERILGTEPEKRVVEAAVSGEVLGIITEDGRLGFLPADFSAFDEAASFRLRVLPSPGYTRLSGTGGGSFVLWQTEGRDPPAVPVFPDGTKGEPVRNDLRFPLRSVSFLDGKLLFFDVLGNAAVLDAFSLEKIFAYSAAGAMDAALIDGNNLLFGRGAVSGSSAFLKVNIVNGETVPLDWPVSAGVKVYRGISGAVYAAAIEETPLRTSFFILDPARPSSPLRLFEYDGEDTLFDIAECGGIPAVNPGREEAFIPGSGETLERSQGLPIRLFASASHFMVLDGAGGIAWQDSVTGALLAYFTLDGDGWKLRRDGLERRGAFSRDSDSSALSQ